MIVFSCLFTEFFFVFVQPIDKDKISWDMYIFKVNKRSQNLFSP